MNDVLENLLKLQKLEMETKRLSAAAKQEIASLREKVPPPILAHYDRLRERGKKGVSIVNNGVCSECHMRVAVGVVATLMHGDDIQLCGTCGRYLYLPEDATVGHLTHPSAAKPEGKKRKGNAPAHVH